MRFSFVIIFMLIAMSAYCQDFNVVEAKLYNTESNKIAKEAVMEVRAFYSEKLAKGSKLRLCQPYQNALFDDDLVKLMAQGTIKSIQILTLNGDNLDVNVSFDTGDTIALDIELKNNRCNTILMLQRYSLFIDPIPKSKEAD